MTVEEQRVFDSMQMMLDIQAKQLDAQAKQLDAQAKQLDAQAKQLEAQARLIEGQSSQLEYQGKLLEKQNKQIEELLRKLEERKKDSHNSSKPPSSDGYGKKPAPKSLNEKSGKKRGGQPGHQGKGFKIDRKPDEVVDHYPFACEHCPNRGSCESRCCESRYVMDLKVETRLTQHKVMECVCPLQNGSTICGTFPTDVTSTKQYGLNSVALVSLLSSVGMVSIDRIHQIMDSLGLTISQGTIQNMLRRFYSRCKVASERIHEIVMRLPLLNCDETGLRSEGSLHWLHCACDSRWSYYFFHKKRGMDAIEEMAVLPGYTGIMVHDCWSPYFKIDTASHALCGAHIARELVYAEETLKQPWAGELKALLFEILREKQTLLAEGAAAFPPERLQKYHDAYAALIKEGYEKNPIPEATPQRRGRPYRGKIRALLDRLNAFQEEFLRFASDWSVPFTNNEAERSIRFLKIRQKVSGSFRSDACATQYAEAMSFLRSARKHGVSYTDAIQRALRNEALSLVNSWA